MWQWEVCACVCVCVDGIRRGRASAGVARKTGRASVWKFLLEDAGLCTEHSDEWQREMDASCTFA